MYAACNFSTKNFFGQLTPTPPLRSVIAWRENICNLIGSYGVHISHILRSAITIAKLKYCTGKTLKRDVSDVKYTILPPDVNTKKPNIMKMPYDKLIIAWKRRAIWDVFSRYFCFHIALALRARAIFENKNNSKNISHIALCTMR